MRLDKLQFARLISFIQACTNRPFEGNELARIDELCDTHMPPAQVAVVPAALVDELLVAIQTGRNEGFIPAIKAYRTITGVGLKEAKDAVEKFRV